MADGQEESSSQKIKDAALRLFSSRGIDAVTVREIVSEAGARNNASLHYYFGSKDRLIDELILDCAHLSDTARIARLDELEAQGGPRSVADVVRLIIEVETTPREILGGSAAVSGSGHMRFVMGLKINHRKAFMQAMAGHRTSGYMRCIEHIYRMMPDTAKSVLNQRLIFMDLFIGASLAAREAAFEVDTTGGKLWGSADAVENLIASTCALLTVPQQ
ncbi:helix-turn-helix domain-containing protein [Sedimentitalea sp. XS_ASV28]|uniref:helix-turn-helix domain-containing protein n=1 Tax=Sedimentitalea sp. XS_ASV28 TaxID=3241296 RepID=UPI0035175A6D